MTPVRERRKETGRLNEYPNPLKQATVLGAIKTKPLRVGLPARLDSPARGVFQCSGRGEETAIQTEQRNWLFRTSRAKSDFFACIRRRD